MILIVDFTIVISFDLIGWSNFRLSMVVFCCSIVIIVVVTIMVAYAQKLVEKAYSGRPINEVFDWFEEKPLASGSIAQVHKAVLDGEVVAVKVSQLHRELCAFLLSCNASGFNLLSLKFHVERSTLLFKFRCSFDVLWDAT